MIENLPFHDRRVAVLGLARSGLMAAKALKASGAKVLAWDDDETARQAADQLGIEIIDLAQADPQGWSALVTSPGIPLSHPVTARATAAAVPVIGDIELLWRAGTGAKFLGITGTNGKSTTTSLIGHVLTQAKHPVAVGGNLGIPVLSLPKLGSDGSYVIEMSSFQLDLVDETRFSIAILLNVTADHLDRHGDMAGYITAKRRIFRRQTAADTAIIGVDDDWCREIADELTKGPARLVRVSAERPVARGVYVVDGHLVDNTDDTARPVMDLRSVPTLPGRHNWQNAAATYAACSTLGLDASTIAAGIASFPGLPHRQELVGRLGKVRFINDSKATNADAASKALLCYEPIYWIAGGVPKAGGIASLAEFFPRVRHAFLIGSAAKDFAETLEGKVPSSLSGDLSTAVRAAAGAATSDPAEEPVVLLSPACASYDQFKNFEVRGDAFRQLVMEFVSEPAR
jgi:UDP-N-acetylmuramoylalanine--D-glutamate ligase